MNSGKAVDRPTLQGQRIKTRKRDEKERTDPQAFRDSIIAAFSDILNSKGSPLTEEPASTETVDNGTHKESPLLSKTHLDPLSKTHLDLLSKFLDEKGSSKDCDYRIYGENLLDILLAGGLLGRFCLCLCIFLSFSFIFLSFLFRFSSTQSNSTWRDNHH